MKTLFKIAWRNCWRNVLRSGIVIGAIILGMWSSLFILGMMGGFLNQRVDKMVNLQLGDIQIHAPTFDNDQDITNQVIDKARVIASLEKERGVASYSPRSVIDAFARSPHGQRGVRLIGVDADLEKQTLGLEKRLESGTFLDSDLSYPILVGKKMAEKLQLRLKSKLQVSFTSLDGNQLSKNFKVCGIFNAGDDSYDGFTVFVPNDRLEKLIGENLVHEIIIKVNDTEQTDMISEKLGEINKENLVESWSERFPQIAYSLDIADTVSLVLMSIIVLALLFGIVNTLIMSILERKQELGVLMAIGMVKGRVRIMIIMESLIYGLIGAPIGVGLGYLTVQYFTEVGIDLSSVGTGMQAFGYDPVLYFNMEPKYYLIFALFIVFATLFAGVYPSRLATKLNPVDAIRSI
jgi:ABC-type lipoprotein release transport system permease subunit